MGLGKTQTPGDAQAVGFATDAILHGGEGSLLSEQSRDDAFAGRLLTQTSGVFLEGNFLLSLINLLSPFIEKDFFFLTKGKVRAGLYAVHMCEHLDAYVRRNGLIE